MIVRCIAACLAFAAGSAAAELTSVTKQEVWRAVAADLRGRGVADRQLPQLDDIDLPLALPALAGRQLRVLSACWEKRARRVQFRLACSAPGQCLPFLAYLGGPIHGEEDPGAGNAGAGNPGDGDAGENLAARAASCRAGTAPLPAPALLKPAVRPGDRATAVFIAHGLRMTASVTCLERGHEGEIIRVRTPDGHIFRARISGPARLEAVPR